MKIAKVFQNLPKWWRNFAKSVILFAAKHERLTEYNEERSYCSILFIATLYYSIGRSGCLVFSAMHPHCCLMGHSRPQFHSVLVVLKQFYRRIVTDPIGIRTRTVGVEGHYARHLTTTTTAQDSITLQHNQIVSYF